ncbi:MAG: Gfo/Idh/MocA family protein, partial [Actinomycetota bacterium]
MTRPVTRLGLVGAGRLAEVGYLPALADVPELRLVAVADPDRAQAEAVARAGGSSVAAFAQVEELVASGEVDAVIVASPPAHHRAGAEAVAAAGLPALVEKPPATDLPGAQALARLRPAPWIAFNRRFDPGLRALRQRLPRQGLLELDLRLAYRRASWSPRVVDDDVLLDLGPHVVDLAQWLTGAPVEAVSADLSPTRARLHLAGDRLTATVALTCEGLHHEAVSVRTGGRRIRGHRAGGPIGLVTGRDAAARGRPHPLVTSLAEQLRAFAAAVRGEPAPDLAVAAEGVAGMAVLDAARR